MYSMTKKWCGLLTQLQLTKWLATTNRFITTVTDHVGIWSAAKFFYKLCRVKQLVQLLLSCCPISMKNKKIDGLRQSITSTSCTPVGWRVI